MKKWAVARASFTGGLESLTFANPTVGLVINGDANDDDIITFTSLDTNFRAAITVNTQGGGTVADIINVNTAFNLGSGTSNGNVALTADTINLGANINTDASGTAGTATFNGTTRLTAATVTIDTDGTTADGAILLNGTTTADVAGRDLNLNAGSATVTIAAFDGSGGGFVNDVTITANALQLAGGAIQLDGNGAGAADAGDFILNSSAGVAVNGNTSIDTEQGDDQAGGNIDLGTNSISANAVDLGLSLDASGSGTGGNITFGTVSNLFNMSQFLAGFSATTSSTGEISLDRDISTDVSVAVGTPGVLLAGRVEVGADVTIDTDSGAGVDVGGAIDLSAATVFADGNNIDLDLDTSATTTGGAVSLGTFDNTGGSGFLNTLDINTSASTPGTTTLNGGIQLSDNGTATASALNFTGGGDVIVSTTLSLNLSSATKGTQAGSIDFGGSTISADNVTGFDLTINTSHTDATAGDDGSDGGNVGNLAAITRDGRERLRSVLINMNAVDGTDADGTLSFSGTTPIIETLASFGAATNGIEILGNVTRSEERRVEQGCRSRWSPYQSKQNQTLTTCRLPTRDAMLTRNDVA